MTFGVGRHTTLIVNFLFLKLRLVRKIISHRSLMQTDQSKHSGQGIIPETRKTSFSASAVYPRVGFYLSASDTDDRFYLSHIQNRLHSCSY